MKQISNWVFGSFFRTIGRLLVFVLLGVLIANFVDFGSLKDNFSITNLLGIETVKADTHTSSWFIDYYKDSNKTQLYTTTNYYALAPVSNNGTNVSNVYLWFSQNIYKRNKNEDYIMIPIMILGQTYNMSQYSYIEYYCDNWVDFSQSGENPDYSCYSTSTNTAYDYEVVPPELHFVVKLYSSNMSNASCTMEGNYAKCNLMDGAYYTGVKIEYNYSLSNSTNNLYIGVNQGIYAYKDVQQSIVDQQEQTTNAITNQTQQQQQQHQEMMDSNTTQAENEASDFFSDFEVEDHGGLSGIITAPLSTIQSLLNNTCTNLVLPLPFVNENLTLPCMNSIYTEHFGAFFTIYQTIILAIISYRCLRSLFYDVRGFINPDDDRIEVMDL